MRPGALGASLLVALAFVAPGCSNDDLVVECEADSNCNRASGGECTTYAPSGRSYCTYPDETCPTGRRWSDLDVGDGLEDTCVGFTVVTDAGLDAASDAGEDAGFDAPGLDATIDADIPLVAFEVAYADDWIFSVPGPIGGWALIVNVGSVGLSMETLEVVGVTDDHPTASVAITAIPSDAIVLTERAAGDLSPLSEELIVDSGLVTETRVDTDSNYFDMELINAPAGTYDINVVLTIALSEIEVTLPLVIHHVPGPVIYVDPQHATRVPSF